MIPPNIANKKKSILATCHHAGIIRIPNAENMLEIINPCDARLRILLNEKLSKILTIVQSNVPASAGIIQICENMQKRLHLVLPTTQDVFTELASMQSFQKTKAMYESLNMSLMEFSHKTDKRLGSLIIAEYFDCKNMPTDAISMERIMQTACENVGLTVMQRTVHTFSPHGISGVFILSESHFSVHTWPEYKYIAIDLFSCKPIGELPVLQYLAQEFSTSNYCSSLIPRGL